MTYILTLYLTFFLAVYLVEVSQGTLGVDGRGGGPAVNTGRGWSWRRRGGGEGGGGEGGGGGN